MRSIGIFAVIAYAATASAAPAPHAMIRPGANHRLGDDSFVAAFGRAPTGDDAESVRMHVHLQYVHDVLAARPATAPALAPRRAELLHDLDDYIAARITPRNTYVPWRTPVFIDRDGRICAVGYLIERTAGRALPEKIAATHRLDYLEAIAAAMPEVAAWVASSGLTLDELASIQPGYLGPEVQALHGWITEKQRDTAADADQQSDATAIIEPVADGPYTRTLQGVTTTGTWAHGAMTGAWQRVTKDGKVIGRGTLKAGSGTWIGYRLDGTRLAEGAYAHSRPSGTWKFYYADGKLAATGALASGRRQGTWTFYYDDAKQTVLSRGSFAKGIAEGTWKHYAPTGKLLATASGTPWEGGLFLDIEPDADGVRHRLAQGVPAESTRIDEYTVGTTQFYRTTEDALWRDRDGDAIVKTDAGFELHGCKPDAAAKRAMRRGDLKTLLQLAHAGAGDDDATKAALAACTGAVRALKPAEIAEVEKAMAAEKTHYAPVPSLAFAPATLSAAEPSPDGEPPADDMATYLRDHMTWYMEWPHVDDAFIAVYRTLAGYPERYSNYDPEGDDS